LKPRVTVKVQFGKAARPAPVPEAERVLRVARLLALAHYIEEKIRAGEIKDLAAAARELGLTRARVTQIVNAALIAPAILDAILAAPPVANGRDAVTERMLRPLLAEPVWQRQIAMWDEIKGRTAA